MSLYQLHRCVFDSVRAGEVSSKQSGSGNATFDDSGYDLSEEERRAFRSKDPGALYGLGLHLQSGAAVDPATAVTFPASPEGREFVRRAADGWASAAVAAGDEPAVANAAADRTVSFYTGAPDDVPGG